MAIEGNLVGQANSGTDVNFLQASPRWLLQRTASMHAAQVAMIDGKKHSAPFYWAPFVLVGEWK